MSNSMEIDVACNLCGSKDREPLREDTNWKVTFVRCRSCGLMFYSPRFTEEHVITTYLWGGDAEAEAKNLFENGVLVGEPRESPEKQKALLQDYYRLILGYQSGWFRTLNDRAPRSLFEVGSSVGWYMKVARDEFLNSDPAPLVQGCDANRFAAQVGRDGFRLDIFGGPFQACPTPTARFDLLAALDYIEHTYAPRQDLEKLRRIAAPGAVLVLKTFLHELDNDGAYVHPVFHVHHFTAATLRRLLETAGWRVLEFDDQRERVYAQVTVFATPA